MCARTACSRAARRRQREPEGGACSCATRPTRAAPAQSTFLLRFLLAVWVHTLGGLKPDAAVSAVTKWFVRRSVAPAQRHFGSVLRCNFGPPGVIKVDVPFDNIWSVRYRPNGYLCHCSSHGEDLLT